MLLAEAQGFGDLVTRSVQPYTEWPTSPEAGRCLRVGLVSGDLRTHPVGYFVESILCALTSGLPGRLEFIAYSGNIPNNANDAVTERIKACCTAWNSTLDLSDEKLARKIHDDCIDILICLSGHTALNRLPMFAWKPAPIQINWLGYFPTTGVSAVDYVIADPWVPPQADEQYFTEQIYRLPETYVCFTPPDFEVPIVPLAALSVGHVTFGSFNNLLKISDDVVALWARVLLAVPDSRLFLKTKQLSSAGAKQAMQDRFAAHCIGADRLILEGDSPRAELLAAYQQVDIALDPFPLPGGTTSVEALWMGVPVLSLVGERFMSHIGKSILQNAGLPDWIATDADDYVARSVSYAGDLPRLAALHDGLRAQVLASPLFDAPRFARHFEAALRAMWMQWIRQQVENAA